VGGSGNVTLWHGALQVYSPVQNDISQIVLATPLRVFRNGKRASWHGAPRMTPPATPPIISDDRVNEGGVIREKDSGSADSR
jgi:hypothetical protein